MSPTSLFGNKPEPKPEPTEEERRMKREECLGLIQKIEFFEKHSSNLIIPYTEIQVTVSDLKKFVAYCEGERWEDNKELFDWEMKKVAKSMGKRPPKFKIYLGENGDVIVSPRENKIIRTECGIHYIGQHIFDFIPYEDREIFRRPAYEKDFVLGIIRHYQADKHPDRFPEYNVKGSDIYIGFMQSREENLKYGDSFYMFVRSRREKENAKTKQ